MLSWPSCEPKGLYNGTNLDLSDILGFMSDKMSSKSDIFKYMSDIEIEAKNS